MTPQWWTEADEERVARAICTVAEGTDMGPRICYLDYMGEARAALAAMPPQGWQPIETAPRDGTRILLFIPPPFNDPSEIGITVGARGTSIWWLSCIWAGSSADRQPTHWQPLPAPPEAAR